MSIAGAESSCRNPARVFEVAKTPDLDFHFRDMPISELIELLRRREDVIADHAWRDRDAAGHLAALQRVSEELAAWTLAHRAAVDAQLRHFLSNASYAKALPYAIALQERVKGN
jgi:hypothetical protein